MQFKGRAADHWVLVVAAARVTATTSGIGHNSVLYRCLRDMLLAYPATGIKANLLLRKACDLPWNRLLTVVQTASQTLEYYEAYDRAVGLTQNLGATLLVPDQDWPTRFTEMQVHFPEWANKLVVDHPGRFTTLQTCWTALVDEAARKAAGKAMVVGGGGLAQLVPCTVCDLEAPNDAYVLPARLLAPVGGSYEDEEYLFHDCVGGGLFAMGRTPGCWRCGSKEHLRTHCSYPVSVAELAGAPVNQWAKLPPRPSPSTSRAAGVVPGALPPRMVLPPPQTSADHIADYATKEDIAHILTKIKHLLSAQPGMHHGAVGQMATSAPPTASSPPLIVVGPQPEGYVYVGSHRHVGTIWGSMDTVAESMMETWAAGNDEGM